MVFNDFIKNNKIYTTYKYYKMCKNKIRGNVMLCVFLFVFKNCGMRQLDNLPLKLCLFPLNYLNFRCPVKCLVFIVET